MADVNTLASRIDAEFAALDQKVRGFQAQQTTEYTEREQRLKRLGDVFERLRDVWRPRLELLQKKFGDRAHVKPRFTPSTREAVFEFQSELARICLKFSATTDRDVAKLILSSDLEIVPVLMRYDAHSEVEYPIDRVDDAAVGRWVDDRIVSFVRTYLSLHENDFYLKDHMVEDPVAKVRFPKFAAAATLERNGRTYYFVGDETRREFEKQNR